MNTMLFMVKQMTSRHGYEGSASAHNSMPTLCPICGKTFNGKCVEEAGRSWSDDRILYCRSCRHVAIRIDNRVDLMSEVIKKEMGVKGEERFD